MITDSMNISVQTTGHSRVAELLEGELLFGRTFSDHMFIADYENGSWSNFQIIPYQKMNFAPSAMVFHYGQAIFEGMKAHKDDEGNALLFRPEDNIKRFNKSAERMCMPTFPEEVFMQGLKQLVSLDVNWIPQEEGGALYIRPFMISTDECVGVRPSDKYRFMIITCPVGKYYNAPVKVKIEKEFTRAADGGTGYAKAAGNYAAALYPAKLGQEQGYHQLVWTDAKEHKYIEESGTMNIMFVINNTLVTPAVSSTTLKGVTRDSIIKIAKAWGWQVEERKISVDEVVEAAENGTLTEAFGMGTAATIAHIASIHNDGKDHDLPALENREFSVKAQQYLDKIKRNQVEDTFGWLVQV